MQGSWQEFPESFDCALGAIRRKYAEVAAGLALAPLLLE